MSFPFQVVELVLHECATRKVYRIQRDRRGRIESVPAAHIERSPADPDFHDPGFWPERELATLYRCPDVIHDVPARDSRRSVLMLGLHRPMLL
ncbi:MAG: hypothetical protein F4151_04510 [Gammaproteobacteria bacterium]|nr:hypothetical protein [Gammaproteobacteria bacterium]